MSGTLVSNSGKPDTDTLLSDGIAEPVWMGYWVCAPVASMFLLSQYRFCQVAPAGLVSSDWNSPKSLTDRPAACAPLQMKPDFWWPRASFSVS